MESTILLIAQISATLTTLMGIVALVRIFRASRAMAASENIRGILNLSVIFLIFGVVGTGSMALYHINEDLGGYYVQNVWYALMFIALILSIYESWSTVKIKKNIYSSLQKIGRSRKKKK